MEDLPEIDSGVKDQVEGFDVVRDMFDKKGEQIAAIFWTRLSDAGTHVYKCHTIARVAPEQMPQSQTQPPAESS
jgi:hypothetical protein